MPLVLYAILSLLILYWLKSLVVYLWDQSMDIAAGRELPDNQKDRP